MTARFEEWMQGSGIKSLKCRASDDRMYTYAQLQAAFEAGSGQTDSRLLHIVPETFPGPDKRYPEVPKGGIVRYADTVYICEARSNSCAGCDIDAAHLCSKVRCQACERHSADWVKFRKAGIQDIEDTACFAVQIQ